MAAAQPEKIDLFKLHRDQYRAGKKPALVTVGKAQYLSISGNGAPGDDAYVEAVGALYGVAYTVKMTRKYSGQGDYVVGKLECNYPDGDCAGKPMAQWSWTLMIRTPDVVGKADLTDAREKLSAKGKGAGTDRVVLTDMAQGQCVQMLHVGPYDQEPVTVAQMLEFAAAEGLSKTGEHHEIYLSDPRRVAPEKLRTILRIPVRTSG